MPAYLVHRIAGEKVLTNLPMPVAEINAFIPGLQGGDLFFFFKYAKPFQKKKISRFGSMLHRCRTRDFFENSMRYIKDYAGEGRQKLISYFKGYIVHYCVDKTVHPFVFGRTEGVAAHNRLEFTLDSLYVQDEWNMKAGDFDISADLYREPLCGAIGEWFAAMDKALYGFGLKKETAIRSLEDFARVRKKLRKPGAFFYCLAAAVRLLSGTDVRMFLHPEKPSWDFFTREEYAHLKALVEEAVSEAAEKIGAFDRYLKEDILLEDAMALFENRNFRGDLIDT